MSNGLIGGHPLPPDEQVGRILHSIWEEAARLNPHLLTKLPRDYEFNRLRKMIRDCLKRGLSEAETHNHTLQELRQSAIAGRRPNDKCDGVPVVSR
jgi:hypothetical protein